MMEVPQGDTYYVKFTTRSFSTGAPTQLLGTPVISVYEEANLTQITAGVTLTIDYDSVTGLNHVAIVATSGNGYDVGSYYSVVITTGTVGGVSVVGEVVGHFRVMEPEGVAGLKETNVKAVADTTQTAGDLASLITTVDTVVDTINTNVGTAGAGLTNIGTIATVTNLTNAPTNGDLTATMKASVNTEVDNAIETYHLDHLLAVDYDPAVKPGVATALLNELVENDGGGVSRYTAGALAQAPDTTTGLSLTADQSGVTIGTVNALAANSITAGVIATDAIDADALAADAIAEINVTVDAALADISLDHLISSALPTSWAVDVAAGSVFDQVADDGTAAYDRTTDSLQAQRDNVGSAVAASISADIAQVDTVVDGIQTDLDNGTDGLGAIKTQTAAIETDTQDVQARLPAALIGGRMDSDVEAINNSTTAAIQLALSAAQIESGSCEGTPSTTVIQTDLAETQDDIYIGRTVIFTSGNARGEATDITDYTGSTGTITVTALANAPAASDTFILI